jgi:hypothetical protein
MLPWHFAERCVTFVQYDRPSPFFDIENNAPVAYFFDVCSLISK